MQNVATKRHFKTVFRRISRWGVRDSGFLFILAAISAGVALYYINPWFPVYTTRGGNWDYCGLVCYSSPLSWVERAPYFLFFSGCAYAAANEGIKHRRKSRPVHKTSHNPRLLHE
jgi:hypothetical protein